MSDAIPPALTPDEWSGHMVQRPRANMIFLWPVDDGWTQRADHTLDLIRSGSPAVPEPADWAALAAFANAALPDGDPRKLTREDVLAVESEAARRHTDSLEHYDGTPEGEALRRASRAWEDYERLTRIAAKLAALLPPAEPGA